MFTWHNNALNLAYLILWILHINILNRKYKSVEKIYLQMVINISCICKELWNYSLSIILIQYLAIVINWANAHPNMMYKKKIFQLQNKIIFKCQIPWDESFIWLFFLSSISIFFRHFYFQVMNIKSTNRKSSSCWIIIIIISLKCKL